MKEEFRKQAKILVESKMDFIILEVKNLKMIYLYFKTFQPK